MSDKYTEEWLEREFIGYGFDQPDPKWPGGAKVCVSFVVQYYMGAEVNVLEGDKNWCAEYLEIPSKVAPTGIRNESSEMMYEYGAREGVPRLLNLFNKYKVPVTWNIFTRALEKAPYWVRPILDSGAEVSCGGHKYRDNFYVDPKEENELIGKSIDTLQTLTGDETLPKGWLVERRSNLSTKLYSLAHAERQLPLLYSSDSCADDLPYWIPSPARSASTSGADRDGGLLMIPFSYDCSDLRFKMKGSGFATPVDYYRHLKDTFDCLYEEGQAGEAKMMTVLLHPHVIGRPNRLYWLEEFVKYVTSKPDAWVARRMDIANHWTKEFPYDPKTAFGQTKVAECGQIKIPS